MLVTNNLKNLGGVALSGMNTSQAMLNNSILNTSNALNEDYTRREVQLSTQYAAGTAYGVKVQKVNRVIDQNVLTAIVKQNSTLASSKTYQEYNDQIQAILGDPNQGNNIMEASQKFFKSVSDLAGKPEFASLRFLAIKDAKNLTDSISSFASSLNDLRVQADRDIYESVQEANRLINEIDLCNKNHAVFQKNNGDILPILDKREAAIRKLAEIIPVRTFEQDNGQIGVLTTQGTTILNAKFKYLLDYAPAVNSNVFTDHLTLSPLNLVPAFGENPAAKSITLMTSGISTAPSVNIGEIDLKYSQVIPQPLVKNMLETSRLTALQDIRDNDIPNTIAQLDSLASSMRDMINKVHNTGSGYPGANSLTGTKNISSIDTREFSGDVRIAVLDQNGSPVLSQDGLPYPPLTLNLDRLTSGSTDPSPTIGVILDEINQYFSHDPTMTHTSLGNLYDIRIASKTDVIAANGNFAFDFELVNRDNDDSLFQINNIEVYDASNTLVSGALTGGLPSDFQINTNTRTRTNSQIDLDFSSGTGGPYTVKTSVNVINQRTGKSDNAVLNFTVNDTPLDTEIFNKRYCATSVQSGVATIISASTTQSLLQANIVSGDGRVMPDGVPGYVNLTAKNPNHMIVIDDLNSKELGYNSATYTYTATNRGVGHFLGLNNLFVDTYKTDNAASDLKIREDISENPNLLSVGRLASSPSYPVAQSVGITQAKTNLHFFGALPSVGDKLTIDGIDMTFVASSSSTDEITIGADWVQTANNIVNALNVSNATTKGTIDKASYRLKPDNSIDIVFKTYGNSGNNFIVNGSLTATDTIIDSVLSPTPNFVTSLKNGQNEIRPVIITPPTYQVSIGSADTVRKIADIGIDSVNFKAAGDLPNMRATLTNYGASIISIRSINAAHAKLDYKQQDDFLNNLQQKFRSVSGVNIDEEAENANIYILSTQANAKAFEAVSKLYEMLFQIIR